MNTDHTPPAETPVPDEALMQGTADGDPSAFTALVRRHQDPLLNFFRRVGAYTDAEDLVQETLVRVFNYRARYRPTAKFTTFLYTVARHAWLDSLRKAKRRESLAENLKKEEGSETDDGGMHRLALKMDAQEALSRLPEKMRSVVVLSLYQGLRYDEIAAVLKIPPGTVKSRMFHALNQLKEILESEHAQSHP